jgi:hypothetical protein
MSARCRSTDTRKRGMSLFRDERELMLGVTIDPERARDKPYPVHFYNVSGNFMDT